MFILQGLEDVKLRSVKHLNHSDALPQTTLLNNDRYEILFLEEICERVFIYKAFDSDKDQFVSIKEFFPRDNLGFQEELYFLRDKETYHVAIQDSDDFKKNKFQDLIKSFIDEAKYLEKISYGDPVLRIIDAFEDYNTAYIISNYNQWPSVQDYLDLKHKFTPEELDWISNELLDIVMRFHKKMIVHRNINPKNIYIKPDELIVDSIGTCDFLQEIKIYDADEYNSKYHGPEVMMHNGVVGTWTDVYAIGKVLIDMISMMSDSHNYFDGLNTLNEKQGEAYKSMIRSAISFEPKNRILDAVGMKKELMYETVVERPFKTPKTMIMAIAMISFISSMMLVLTYNNDTMLAENYVIIEEEEVPLGSVVIDNDDCYFVINEIKISRDESIVLKWFASTHAEISHLILVDKFGNILNIDLENNQSEIDITDYSLNVGSYQVRLYYKVKDEIFLETMTLEILE